MFTTICSMLIVAEKTFRIPSGYQKSRHVRLMATLSVHSAA